MRFKIFLSSGISTFTNEQKVPIIKSFPILLVLTTILMTLTCWLIPIIEAQGSLFNFEFQKFGDNQIKMFNFLGQARLNSVSQTLQLSDPTDANCETSPCVGQVFFPQPVQVRDGVTNKTYSFSTSFTFTITSPMKFPTGDGFVFLMAANPLEIPVGAGTFGCFLPNPGKSVNSIVAVEFDTSMDSDLYDINDNHVGIDINYAQSLKASDANILSIKLASGLLITSWIDYHHLYKLIEVRLSYYRVGETKPIDPFFTLPIDLSRSWTPQMYVGFSTQVYHGSEQSCNIFSWSFRSFVETVLPPPPPSPSWPPPPEYNGSSNSTWYQKTVELGKLIGVAAGAFLLIVAVCSASIGYARFGCSEAPDPVDLLDPNESTLIDTKKKKKEVDDIERNGSADAQALFSTKRNPSLHTLGFGDIMFSNVLYDVPFVGIFGEHVKTTAGPNSKEIMEISSESVKDKGKEITRYDNTRAPLQEQVALLLETARADVENYTEAQRFTYKEMSEATDNFSESLQLGEGRYGVFYGGILANGVQIAVKRLTTLKQQDTRRFKDEVSMLYRLQHPNLVRLLGWCKQSQEYFVVYNLMSNGNLSRIIFHKGILPWQVRLRIIQNVADALEYLHGRNTLHKNVKTTNIFLTNENDGKLGDFGLTWLMDHDEEKGTKEYVAPEVRITHELTKQTDVFSFGIVILEILCERPFYDPDADPDALYLVNLISTLVDSQKLRKVVSKNMKQLEEEADDPLMTLVANLGLLCCDRNPAARPSMMHVVECLAGDIPFPPVPESPQTDTTTRSYKSTPPNERIISVAATTPKKSRSSPSSSESQWMDTAPPNKTTPVTKKKNSTAVIGPKKRPWSNASPRSPLTYGTPHKITSSNGKKERGVAIAPKKSKRLTTLPLLTTEKKDKLIATTSKNSQEPTSSSKSPKSVTTLPNRQTSNTKKNSTVDRTSKSPWSPSLAMENASSTHGIPRSSSQKVMDAVTLSSEQQITSASTGHTPSSKKNRRIPSKFSQVSASLDPLLARQGPLVMLVSAPRVDLGLRPATASPNSSLELVEDNNSKIQPLPSPTIKAPPEFSDAPNIQPVQLRNEVNSFGLRDENEFHVSTTYRYCYSLLEQLVSILLKYVDDDDNTFSETFDSQTFQHDANQTALEKPPDPPSRPPPIPQHRPPIRPPPSPVPIPEPDPPFPLPDPIPHRPPPLRPPPPPLPRPPQPPPPQGPETLTHEVSDQRKGQLLKPYLGKVTNFETQSQSNAQKKPISRSDQIIETNYFSHTPSTLPNSVSQKAKASPMEENPSSKSIKSKVKLFERSTTKPVLESSQYKMKVIEGSSSKSDTYSSSKPLIISGNPSLQELSPLTLPPDAVPRVFKLASPIETNTVKNFSTKYLNENRIALKNMESKSKMTISSRSSPGSKPSSKAGSSQSKSHATLQQKQ